MWNRLRSIAFVMLLPACSTHDPASCKVVCATDTDCPQGQTCGELGRCTSGEACPCMPDEFLGCVADSARFCNANANGIDTQSCGAPGCNADAGRCNTCVPDSATCGAGSTQLDHCGSDGLPATSDDCALGCVTESATTPAHCGYLEPMFLPDVCDTPATMADLTIAADSSIDTGTDASCTGGIVTQTNGPEICVLHYGAISLTSGTLTVRGPRAAAFVADDALLVQGTLDVSADTTNDGPGGGSVVTAARAVTNLGGGGAGFRVAGADGGSSDSSGGGGGSGGAAFDPLAAPEVLTGGPRAQLPTFQQTNYPLPGGGGGAVTLISCRAEVSVSGTIDANGGGGQAGRDTNPTTSTNFVGGAGGGAGGYVVLQGANVRVTSPAGAGVFANGGAGGGGCSMDGCAGLPGEDGQLGTTAAQGGVPADQGGTGGNGGTATAPTVGLMSYYAPGGGGAAAGRLQTFTPMSGTATITSSNSPAFDANRHISVR